MKIWNIILLSKIIGETKNKTKQNTFNFFSSFGEIRSNSQTIDQANKLDKTVAFNLLSVYAGWGEIGEDDGNSVENIRETTT